jgi:hypothetical protein
MTREELFSKLDGDGDEVYVLVKDVIGVTYCGYVTGTSTVEGHPVIHAKLVALDPKELRRGQE